MVSTVADRSPASRWFGISLIAGVIAILAQVVHPLVHGETRRMLTILSVLAFCAFSCVHSLSVHRLQGVLCVLGVCAGIGLAVEAVGFRTGIPFGNYSYTTSLGLRVLGVPVVVPLAWAMMGWPALLAARRAFRRGVRVSVYGALILTAWDLLLDPQMVDAGHWVWSPTPGPALNEIPMVNSLGWFGVAFVMLTLLDRLLPPTGLEHQGALLRLWPAWVMLAWTWFSESVGHLLFFGMPRVGVIGGAVFGAVLVPWARCVRSDVRSHSENASHSVSRKCTG